MFSGEEKTVGKGDVISVTNWIMSSRRRELNDIVIFAVLLGTMFLQYKGNKKLTPFHNCQTYNIGCMRFR